MLCLLLALYSASMPQLATAAEVFSSKGCYALSDLESVLTSLGEYTYQTNSYCETLCSGYSVAATLDGSTCYCGDSLPSNIASVSSSNCDTECQGYSSEICGGDGYLSVYSTGEEDTDAEESSSSTTTTSSSSSSKSIQSSSSSSISSTSSQTSSSVSSSSSTSLSSSSSTTSSSSTSTSSTASSSSSSSTSTSSLSLSSEGSSSSAAQTAAITSVQVITSIVSASTQIATVTTTIAATTTASSSASASASSTAESKHSSLSKGAIAGIAVGSIFGALLLIASLFLCCCFIIRRNSEDDDEEDQDYPNDLEKTHPNNTPPIHNDDFQGYYGFQQPIAYFDDDDDQNKRLSNGSLIPDDVNFNNKNSLRVTNPDDHAQVSKDEMNDTTLQVEDSVEEGEVSSASDDNYWKK